MLVMLADRLSLAHPLTRIWRDGPINTKTGNFLKKDTSDRVKKQIAKGDRKKSDWKELSR